MDVEKSQTTKNYIYRSSVNEVASPPIMVGGGTSFTKQWIFIDIQIPLSFTFCKMRPRPHLEPEKKFGAMFPRPRLESGAMASSEPAPGPRRHWFSRKLRDISEKIDLTSFARHLSKDDSRDVSRLLVNFAWLIR